MKLNDLDIEHIFLSMFFSSIITLIIYISTMIFIYHIDGYNISLEPIGYGVAIIYYIVTTTTIFLIFKKGK